ncbi:unnamed protein product [Lymnaea stagnalis]|uniref:Sodium/nucleoside cotransporter n=1 Tax=Lymnaea stagnalis TaxID=6523 RepID=A0AAV2HJA0_LYMST
MEFLNGSCKKEPVIDIEGPEDVNPDNDKLEEKDEDSSSSFVSTIIEGYGSKLKWVLLFVAIFLYFSYFSVALALFALGFYESGQSVLPLVYLTVAALIILIIYFVKRKFKNEILDFAIIPTRKVIDKHWHKLKWFLLLVPLCGIVAIILLSAAKRPYNLVSLIGWIFFLIVLTVCSHSPRRISWRPVIGGFALQFYFAAFILKWDKGQDLFQELGSLFTSFLGFSKFGAQFVFGKLEDHFFAFLVLPVIIFFSTVITMLYYLGIMQAIIGKIAFIMRITLGTTAAESLCAAGNIFVGQTEAPIMIRPFLAIMTMSELHAVMVGGFGTIAGAVLAAYILKGVPAAHLIAASVMNAPTALAVSKILYPEVGMSKISKMKEVIKEKQPFNNVIEAAAAGASSAISLVANVGANLIAFVALLFFANSVLGWFGAFVCLPELSFEVICSYILRPLVFIMGVEWNDAGAVAKLLGIKTFLNEFVAYDKLADFINNRVTCGSGTILTVSSFFESEVIATYALCGFANFSSIGIQLGGLGPMAPNRTGDLAKLAVSALFGGIVTNLMTACVAGKDLVKI